MEKVSNCEKRRLALYRSEKYNVRVFVQVIAMLKERLRNSTSFEFYDPGRLVDGDLMLVLYEAYPGDKRRGYVPAYRFRMMREDSRVVGHKHEIGRIELRVSNMDHIVMYAGHIGYRVLPMYRGHHYAARSCTLLLPLARRHDLNPLWITCNPDNYASRRTCELAGATFVEIVDLPEDIDMYQMGERQKCRYRLDL
jgi:predicted acetyltransferase